MIKKTLYRAAAATVLGMSLVTGIAAADTGNINTTGPNSSNKVESKVKNHVHLNNNNNIGVGNSNSQSAYTGDAKVKHNTTGGDATTGDAMNANSTSVMATVSNTASSAAAAASASGGGQASGSISNTGPDSYNKVESSVHNDLTINNNNNISVSNSSTQTATSGDARVSGNTTGGDATSGNASNTNTSTFSFNVSN